MDAPAAATELVTLLERAEAALTSGDTDTANLAMEAAADLCRRLQAIGVQLPAEKLSVLCELADRCGVTLTRLGHELNAESHRDDSHRRGITTYNVALGR